MSNAEDQYFNIGIFLADIDDPYQYKFLRGLEEVCKQYRVNSFVFAGRPLLDQYRHHQRNNVLFHLARGKRLDGIIMLGGILQSKIADTEFRKFCRYFSHIPMINIGSVIEGIPSILIDNEGGTIAEVDHLVKNHGAKRIAYIKGFNYDGESRFKGYLKGLEKNRLPFDETLVIKGDYNPASAYFGIKELLWKGIPFDSVIAASDRMFLGAFQAMTENGLRIPSDIPCTGFDNIEEAGEFIPGITTVNQPLNLMAAMAIDLLLSGEKLEAREYIIPCQLVIRESCGCTAKDYPVLVDLDEAGITCKPGSHAGREKDLKRQVLEETFKGFSLTPGERDAIDPWFLDLISFYLDNMGKLEKIEDFSFLHSRLTNIPVNEVVHHDPESFFMDLLTSCCRSLIKLACREVREAKNVEVLFHRSYMIVSDLLSRSLKYSAISRFEKNMLKRETETDIISSSTIYELLVAIIYTVKSFQMESVYLCAFSGYETSSEEPDSSLPDFSRLLLAYDKNAFIEEVNPEIEFETVDILPSGFFEKMQNKQYICYPLVFSHELFGYMLLEKCGLDVFYYEQIVRQVSYTLKNISLLGELNDKIKELTDAKIALEEMSERAQAASKAKSHFVTNVTHELRTPLNSILGYAELLLEQETDEEKKRKLKTIGSSGNILLSLINDILDFSKIEAGAQTLNTVTFSARKMLEEVRDMFSLKAIKKGLNFDIHYEGHFPEYVAGDAGKIRQVLTNLLGNAFKFTHHGGVAVQCIYADEHLLVIVKDTGIGIPEEKLMEVFDPFFQVGNVIHKKYEGTGLGLAITKKLVDLMCGEISVESLEGEWTCFTFRVHLPETVKSVGVSGWESRKLLDKNPLEGMDASVLKILVVEDLELNRQFLAEILRIAGIMPDFAEDGHGALSMMRHTCYDLVIMDVYIPGMDGIEVVKSVRNNPEYGKPYILALTASVLADDKRSCLKAGFDDFMTKPVDKRLLFQKIADILSSKESQISAPSGKKIVTTLDRGILESIYSELQENIAYFDVGKIQMIVEKLEAFRFDEWMNTFRSKLKSFADNFDEEGVRECLEIIKRELS